jgi:hypothetical protein
MIEALLVLILLALWEQNARHRPIDTRMIVAKKWEPKPLDPSAKGLLTWVAIAIAVVVVGGWIGGMVR